MQSVCDVKFPGTSHWQNGLGWLLTLILAGGCGSAETGPTKYPVQGEVRINGQAAERVAITFHHADAAITGNLRYPTAVTDATGRFEVSSEGDRDGAVAGRYRVTFAWLSSPELDAFDQLQGVFSDPNKSQFEATVPLEQEAGLVFSLVLPENRIRRPRLASQ